MSIKTAVFEMSIKELLDEYKVKTPNNNAKHHREKQNPLK